MIWVSPLPLWLSNCSIISQSSLTKRLPKKSASTINFNHHNLEFFPSCEFEWSGIRALQIFRLSSFYLMQLDTGLTGDEKYNISQNQRSVPQVMMLSSVPKTTRRNRGIMHSHTEINKILPLSLVFIFRPEESTDCLLHMSVSAPRG